MKKTKIYRIGLWILVILSVISITFVVWANMVYKAEPEKFRMASDQALNDIQITEKAAYWEIIPNSSDTELTKYQDAGLIFYPGAKIDPKAYFYKLSDLSNGQVGKMRVFITKPTLNLAFFSINQADQVIQDHPEVKKWIVGGHSLGGAMSCEYIKNHSDKISELWLFAAYCGSDISSLNLNVISIHGSLDGILTPQILSENRKNLPVSALDVEIQGMNHSQVGNYGLQSGDNIATKTDEDVRNEIMKMFSELFSK